MKDTPTTGFNRIEFYKKVLVIAAPVAMQNLFQALINMLDVFMIGQLGAADITAVSMAHSWCMLLFFTFNGITVTGSVFIAQYWGASDLKNIHKYAGMILTFNATVAAVFTLVSELFSRQILSLYSKDPVVIEMGATYLRIMGISFLLVAVINAINVSLMSIEKTIVPMIATIISIVSNTFLNYVLIFGHLGAPRLESKGAAIATVISIGLEFIFVVGALLIKKYPVLGPLNEHFHFTFRDVAHYFKYGFFLIMCEVSFTIANNLYNMAYKYTGTNSQAALELVGTLAMLSNVFATGIGTACAIMLGKKLGENDFKTAKSYSVRFLILIPVVMTVTTVFVALLSPVYFRLFNVEPEVIELAKMCIIILLIRAPFAALNHTIVAGILRSGGDSLYCFLANFVGMCLIGAPLAFIGAAVFHLPIYFVYLLACSDEIGKLIVCLPRVIKGKWIRNIT